MATEEHIRIRTDAIVSFITNQSISKEFPESLASMNDVGALDEMVNTMIQVPKRPSQYNMRDLNKPSPVQNIQFGEAMNDYASTQRRLSSDYVQDWPQANDKNQYGKRHPLSWELPSCPLLQGSQWGEPHFVDHLLQSMNGPLEQMKESERMGHIEPHMRDIMGHAPEDQHHLYHKDRHERNSYLSDEEYADVKREEWAGKTTRLGLLPFLFGQEWQTMEQKQAFMEALRQMGSTESGSHPDTKALQNQIQASSGMTWDRAKRNFFERLIPMARWWERPSHRHGPVSAEKTEDGIRHYQSPYVHQDGAIVPSAMNHHWKPYQYWGGVGRDSNSLADMLQQSYPEAFSGWLGDEMLGFLRDKTHPLNEQEDAYHSSGSSFFPEAANHEGMEGHPHRYALATGWEAGSENPRVRSINSRRGMWNKIANHAQLHPSEVNGMGMRMIVPSETFAMQPLANILHAHSDYGMPRKGDRAENHPMDEEYHNYHNDHYQRIDQVIGKLMQQYSQQLSQEGHKLFETTPGDLRANSLSRGNIQQLAQVANYALMRHGGNGEHTTPAPSMMAGGIAQKEVQLGGVDPYSQATSPAVYLSGDMDGWGHEMDTNIAWKWDEEANEPIFDVKDQPFKTLQLTTDENKVAMVNPIILNHPMTPKEKDVPAIYTTNDDGWSPVVSGDLWKSDDNYEATGIFKTTINPAHTIYDLNDVDDLKGFTGNWVVQSRPEGKRVIVSKSGSHISAHDGKGGSVSLPKEVKEGLRKQSGDCTFDGVLKNKAYRAIDLLVHKGEDIHMDPLEDRLSILRTLYETDEGVSFPMPKDCKFTDREGLRQNVDALGGEVWMRDATSTFMKGKESHHKWVLFAPNGDITKSSIPYVSNVNGSIVLEYSGIKKPVVVKAEWDGEALNIHQIGEGDPISKHATKQAPLWGPVAAHLCKYDMKEITPYPPKIKTIAMVKASMLDANGDHNPSEVALVAARRMIMESDDAMSSKKLIGEIDGLTEDMLQELGGTYGLECTENGEWTVNEALDNEVHEKQGSPLARISGSIQGGGWSGMMDMIDSPRGPTQLVDEEATPMFDPYQQKDGDMPPQPMHITLQTTDGTGEEVEGQVDVEGGRAKMRYPRKTRREAQEEEEVAVPMKDEMPDEMQPMPPDQPPIA